MRVLHASELRFVAGACGPCACNTKNNNGYGNGAESGPPPGNSINNPQLLTWNSGKKGPR